jgi:hypothetical protein
VLSADIEQVWQANLQVYRADKVRRQLRLEGTDRMSDLQASLGHHLDQVAVRQLVAQMPARTQNDDFLLEVTSFEEIALAWTSTHAGRNP